MRYFLSTWAALMAAMSLPAMAAPTPDFRPLASLIQTTKEATGHPSGTAVAVVKDGKILYEGYFGYADISARTPVTRDTVFYLASATKPFFALNTLLQEEAGRLDTRTLLQQMFPDARFAGFDAQAVTIKDLLVHASGVDNQPLVWATAFSGVHDAQSLRALVAASYPDEKSTRGTFKYTNVGYNIVSVWQDRHLALPWQEQLDRTLFQPLVMQRTSAYISKAEAAGWTLAKPYSLVSAQPREPLYLTKSDDTMQAAGGLVSTAPDVAKFLLAQLATGMAGDGQVLSQAVIERSHMPQVAVASQYLDFPRTGYAWGWYTGEYKGRQLLHHLGGFAGFHAHLSFMPEERIGLVVLNNEGVLAPRLTNLIADYVYGVLLQEPAIEAKAARRFDELQTQVQELRLAMDKQRDVIRARVWNLSRPRASYLGTYTDDLLGDMTVESNADQEMVIRWGRLAAVASAGERQDDVRVEFAPNSGAFLTFTVDHDDVAAISFEGMVFKKLR